MSSKKRFFSFILLLATVLFISACNLKIGDEVKPQESVKLTVGDFECLSDIGQTIRDYFDAKVTGKRVEVFFSCLKNSINQFTHFTEGETYKPGDIKNYLNKYWLGQKNQISSDFMFELMKFKAFMIGGSLNSVTRKELKQLIELIEFVRTQAIRLMPYMKLYRVVGVDPTSVDHTSYMAAKNQIALTFFEIGQRMSTSQREYSISSLKSLVTELNEFLNWKNHTRVKVKLDDFMEFFSTFKEINVGGMGDVFRPRDWMALFDSAASWYGVVLDIIYYIKPNVISYGPGLQIFLDTFNRAMSLVDTAVSNQRYGVLTYDLMNRLFVSLEKMKLLPFGLTSHALIESAPVLFNKVLLDNEMAVNEKGITSSSIAVASFEFSLWKDNQVYLNSVISRQMPQMDMSMQLNPFVLITAKFKELAAKFDFSNMLNSPVMPKPLKRIISGQRPYFQVHDHVAHIVYKEELKSHNVFHSIHNLTYMNTIYSLARLLNKGWAKGIRRDQLLGLEASEMQQFYADVKPLGEALDFMDPRSENSGMRIFLEGNLFTFDADGFQNKINNQDTSHLLNFSETLDLLALVFSSGEMRIRLYRKAISMCASIDAPLDVFGKPKYDRQCFMDNFEELFNTGFYNLPHMQSYYSNLNQEKKNELRDAITQMAKVECEPEEWMELTELGTVALVLEYVESLTIQFDKNRNGKLDNYELWNAFERFKGYIRLMIKNKAVAAGMEPVIADLIAVTLDESVFRFIIKHGYLPKSEDLYEIVIETATDPTQDIDWGRIEETVKKDFKRFKDLFDKAGSEIWDLLTKGQVDKHNDFYSKFGSHRYGVVREPKREESVGIETDRIGLIKILNAISMAAKESQVITCPAAN